MNHLGPNVSFNQRQPPTPSLDNFRLFSLPRLKGLKNRSRRDRIWNTKPISSRQKLFQRESKEFSLIDNLILPYAVTRYATIKEIGNTSQPNFKVGAWQPMDSVHNKYIIHDKRMCWMQWILKSKDKWLKMSGDKIVMQTWYGIKADESRCRKW